MSNTNIVHKIWQVTLKNMKNEKYTLQELECGEKTEKLGKGETHTVGCEIWHETLKNLKNEK